MKRAIFVEQACRNRLTACRTPTLTDSATQKIYRYTINPKNWRRIATHAWFYSATLRAIEQTVCSMAFSKIVAHQVVVSSYLQQRSVKLGCALNRALIVHRRLYQREYFPTGTNWRPKEKVPITVASFSNNMRNLIDFKSFHSTTTPNENYYSTLKFNESSDILSNE